MPNYPFSVHLRFLASFTPVVTEPVYVTSDYADAFRHIAERSFTPNKKRQIFVKQQGNRHKHFYYDERFAAELLAQADASSDEFFEEPTQDDLASVRVLQPDKRHSIVRAVWRGANRRGEGKLPPTEDEIPF